MGARCLGGWARLMCSEPLNWSCTGSSGLRPLCPVPACASRTCPGAAGIAGQGLSSPSARLLDTQCWKCAENIFILSFLNNNKHLASISALTEGNFELGEGQN